jgi:peptide/nickel transport system substrate-binding protein
MRRRDLLQAAALPMLAAPAIAAGHRPLRFVPHANLTALDPVWTTAAVTIMHAMMVYDTLYGIDLQGDLHPQMCAGHEVSSDELSWTFTLRDGLAFHDGEKVLARDCVASIKRWAVRDPFGQHLTAVLEEIEVLDDRRFRMRLRKPFRLLLYGLGARYCFIMPERVAKAPATEQIKESIGSGPFRFVPGEWVAGARATYVKNEKYVPRQEPASYFAGGKQVGFERIEWTVQADPSTSTAALIKNEIDWLDLPLIDLVPLLRKSADVTVKVHDPYGWLPIIALNHLQPPFDNPKLRQALLPAIDQRLFVESVVGEQTDLMRVPAGYFTEGHTHATHVGLDVLQGEKGLDRARKLVKESGYNGEKVVLIAPSDIATILQISQVTRELFIKIGLNVDYQVMDWGSLVTRRTNQGPADKGGWNAFNTNWGGLTVSNPGSSFPLRGNGRRGAIGWPTDDRLEALREAWFDASTEVERRAIAVDIQRQALQSVPYVPLGQFFQPTAFRNDIKGIVPAAIALFWGAHRA